MYFKQRVTKGGWDAAAAAFVFVSWKMKRSPGDSTPLLLEHRFQLLSNCVKAKKKKSINNFIFSPSFPIINGKTGFQFGNICYCVKMLSSAMVVWQTILY